MAKQHRRTELQERIVRLEKQLAEQELTIASLAEGKLKYKELYGIARLMADNAPDMLWAKDMQDRYLFANRSLCENLLHSQTTKEPTGKTDLFFAAREREKGYRHTFGEICLNSDAVVKKTRKPGRFLEDGLVRDQYMALDVHKAPFYNNRGEMIGTVGCGRDVTEEISINQALKKSEKRFREIIEEVTEIAIQGYDEKRRVTFWNHASEKMYGYSQAEALGQRLEELIIPDLMKAEVLGLIQGWLEDGEKIPSGELMLEDKYGNEVPVYSSHVMLETPLGREMFCIDIDLTPMKQAEREKAQLQEQLRQSQKMEALGTLAGGIAHDFNNVLASIMGLSELLMEDLSPRSIEHQNAADISIAAKRGSDLVKRILSFSRQSKPREEPVLFQRILSEVISLSRSIIPTNIELVEEIEDDFGVILADATLLQQVALNLISNACHAIGQENGTIRIQFLPAASGSINEGSAISLPGSYGVLKVTDSGPGMAPDIRKKIFDPYFTTKPKGEGTGLGLASVYRIVKDCGGEIQVESALGRGASFTVYLPLMKASQGADATGVPAIPTGGERILIVDDEAQIVATQKQVLSRLGYDVVATTDSLEALRRFQANPHRFDLVITDMAMPRMTGIQLAKAFLELRDELPIIICTGYSERNKLDSLEALGIRTFLIKPFENTELAWSVRNTLDQR